MSVEGSSSAGPSATARTDDGAVARLAAGVAHELRNPLAVILARVQLLRLGLKHGATPDPEKLGQVLTTIEEQAMRASRIIENLSIFARPREPELAPVDLGETVTEVLGMLRERLERAGVGADVDVPAPCRTVQADRGQLAAALATLLTNALEAMPSGGRVGIRARRTDGAIEIGVVDTGPGVAPRDAPRIFDPFFTTKPGAAGLGLCAAQTIAESHGGTVRLLAAGRPGAEFVLSLPVRGMRGR